MPVQDFLSRRRIPLAAGLYLAASGAGVMAWLHAASTDAVMFLCGEGATGHCMACYSAPMLALAGVAVLAAPQPRKARVVAWRG